MWQRNIKRGILLGLCTLLGLVSFAQTTGDPNADSYKTDIAQYPPVFWHLKPAYRKNDVLIKVALMKKINVSYKLLDKIKQNSQIAFGARIEDFLGFYNSNAFVAFYIWSNKDGAEKASSNDVIQGFRYDVQSPRYDVKLSEIMSPDGFAGSVTRTISITDDLVQKTDVYTITITARKITPPIAILKAGSPTTFKPSNAFVIVIDVQYSEGVYSW